jgi:GDPmannose 4,6-dehydratase
MRDFRELLQLISSVQPNEIYNLAGQSSVALSFSQPIETMESIATGELLVLEAIRYLRLPVRLYNSASSECFGDTVSGSASDERTPFVPRSPYATAKATAHWTTTNYREAYGLFACSGILFNHESPLRSERFVTKKVADAAAAIAAGKQKTLQLGNLEISRDWGYAPEYVDAMWRMLQRDEPEDYVVGTGETHSVGELVDISFNYLGLDPARYVREDPKFMRPAEVDLLIADPTKAREELDWQPTVDFEQLVKLMIDADMALLKEGSPVSTA